MALLVAIGVETAIGLLLGLVAQLVFGAVQLAGELAGMQMGFGMASLFDPPGTHDRMVLAQWQSTIGMGCFFEPSTATTCSCRRWPEPPPRAAGWSASAPATSV